MTTHHDYSLISIFFFLSHSYNRLALGQYSFYVIILLVYLHVWLHDHYACNWHSLFAKIIDCCTYLELKGGFEVFDLVGLRLMAARFKPPTSIMNLKSRYLCTCEQLDPKTSILYIIFIIITLTFYYVNIMIIIYFIILS